MRPMLPFAVVLMLPGCATIFGPPDEPPPEALTANLARGVSPRMREGMWPSLFDGKEYVARLVCPADDWVTAKPIGKKGLQETYELDCPGEEPRPLVLDVGYDPPPPPEGFRVIDPASFAKYRDAFAAAEKKDYTEALAALDQAHAIAPAETIYQRDRIYLLYQMGRLSDAYAEADAIAAVHPSAVLYKYRALAARDLGLRSEVLVSLDAMMKLTHEGHPLYAEAVCAKGLIYLSVGDSRADPLIQQGCALNYATCCDVMKTRPPPALQPSAKPNTQASAGTHG